MLLCVFMLKTLHSTALYIGRQVFKIWDGKTSLIAKQKRKPKHFEMKSTLIFVLFIKILRN